MGMELHVVIGVMSGVVGDVAVLSSKERALEERDRFDEEYGIERDEDGDYESQENDVVMKTAILDD